jgi:hypothetical protein
VGCPHWSGFSSSQVQMRSVIALCADIVSNRRESATFRSGYLEEDIRRSFAAACEVNGLAQELSHLGFGEEVELDFPSWRSRILYKSL